jgi:hypothetical protein
MRVSQQTDTFRGPHDDVVVSAARCPPLAVPAVSEGVDNIFVSALLIDDLACVRVVYGNSVANGHQDLTSVRSVADGPYRIAVS